MSRFSSTCSPLLLHITMSNTNIVVQWKVLSELIRQSILTLATKRALGTRGWSLVQSHFYLKSICYSSCTRHCCNAALNGNNPTIIHQNHYLLLCEYPFGNLIVRYVGATLYSGNQTFSVFGDWIFRQSRSRKSLLFLRIQIFFNSLGRQTGWTCFSNVLVNVLRFNVLNVFTFRP